MDLNPTISSGKTLISGYGGGGFKIGHERKEGSIMLFAGSCLAWPVNAAGDITVASLQPLWEMPGIELLLIGTGITMEPIDDAIHAHCKSRNIALDSMDTGAACRTFNVLASEERRVAAAVVAI
jgi:uncharacterized protein